MQFKLQSVYQLAIHKYNSCCPNVIPSFTAVCVHYSCIRGAIRHFMYCRYYSRMSPVPYSQRCIIFKIVNFCCHISFTLCCTVICTGRTAAITQEASYETFRYAFSYLNVQSPRIFYTLLGSCFSVQLLHIWVRRTLQLGPSLPNNLF